MALAAKVNLSPDVDKTKSKNKDPGEIRGKSLSDGRQSYYFDSKKIVISYFNLFS